MKLLSVLLAATALLLVPATSASVQGDISSYRLIGSAAPIDDGVQLTPSSAGQLGAIWSKSRLNVADGFKFKFRFRISDLAFNGADGFAFIIQNQARDLLSGGGGTFGYYGVPSLAVEFDTWMNLATDGGFDGLAGDPNANHISVHTNGSGPNGPSETFSIGATSGIPNLSDGALHTVLISYSPGTLSVYLDDLQTPVLVVPADVTTLPLAVGGKAWIGMVGATGGSWEAHDIFDPEFEVE
jgi:Bacterial lectin